MSVSESEEDASSNPAKTTHKKKDHKSNQARRSSMSVSEREEDASSKPAKTTHKKKDHKSNQARRNSLSVSESEEDASLKSVGGFEVQTRGATQK